MLPTLYRLLKRFEYINGELKSNVVLKEEQMSLDGAAEAGQTSILARCPFCNETFPPHIMTNHCNYCVDMLGQAEIVKMKRRVLAEAQIREAEAAKSTKGAVGGGVASTLRGMVSQNKIRFQEDGFDLDLTYITPRIVAMGFPSHGTEGYYRNPIDEVERFFETRHKNHYRVYNLCSERQYDHQNRFGGAYRRFPFDDHNPPSPISIIPTFCEDAAEWLGADPLNVLAIHCKAGKGRTGVMIAAFLMSTNSTLRKADDALKCFGDSRTHDGKGVTIPSQIRFVYLFLFSTKLLHSKRSLTEITTNSLQIRSILGNHVDAA